MVEMKERRLVGFANFVRHNPLSDKFKILNFHHIEFFTLDATSLCKRLQHGLGMLLVSKSDLSDGNNVCTSFVLQSNDVVFVITAPQLGDASQPRTCTIPGYDPDSAFEFVKKHGVAIRAVGTSLGYAGIRVDDAAAAYDTAVKSGATSVLPPQTVSNDDERLCMAEVVAYGDVVLRFVSGDSKAPFLPSFTRIEPQGKSFGIQRLDHCVGNVPKLFEVTDYLMAITGMHEFAEFTAQDVGTVDSGLNSMVLASNNEYVLLPVNEPTFGTRRKSQIQTYLEHNRGPGVQHLALKTDDIFSTMKQMRSQTPLGGLEFMPRSSDAYYRDLPDRVGDVLTSEQLAQAEDLGILVDKDDQGVLLQIFTKPIGDRPTLFFEIIQRIGCESKTKEVNAEGVEIERSIQAGGCGGFGKGNFKELFKSIERFEEGIHIKA